jgi:electron transfer flavoprotein beta subunit
VAKAAGENTLRSALAMGADRGILVTADERLDSIMTARALKAAILSDGQPGLILTGKESIDAESMQTMFRLAHLIGLPAATNVVSIEPQDGRVLISCEKEAGALEKLQLSMPCILAAGKGLNTPRYPTFPEIVKARKKEIKQITLAELNLAEADSRVELVQLEPIVENRKPQELTGSPVEIAAQIVRVLKAEARVI